MINVVTWLAILILSVSEFYVLSYFQNKKINFLNINFYISLLLMVVVGIFNYFYVNAFIKMILVSFLLGFCNWLTFRGKMNSVVISTLFTYILIAVSDFLGAIVLIVIFNKNVDFIRLNVFGSLVGNILVSLIFLLISSCSFIKCIYSKLIDITDRIRFNSLIRLCLLITISINFLMAVIYYKLDSFLVIVINLMLLCIYSYIIYRTINEKNNNLLIKAENKSLMRSLHQYEDMVDRQRVDNHENKNQLLIIKNMIIKKDKDVVNYIDTVIKDKKEDDEILYTKVKKIPSGGLQGIIYQKMLVMKDKNINFSIDVSRDVRKIDLDNFDITDNYKLCKIIGVFLDNSIEASENIDDKNIMISLYVDDDMMVIEISNKFCGIVDLENIDDEGYTTKGDGHGYGLSLVKKLVDESNIFVNERRINNDIFKQIIKVKVK